jgi:alcohol dehydrogenase (NADP+)
MRRVPHATGKLRAVDKETNMKVDPGLVPTRKLRSGVEIPTVGLGTFGSDSYTNEVVAQAVKYAISEAGFRLIDCASVYQNEKEIGAVLAGLMKEEVVKREDLWITSKVWNDMHGAGDIARSCKQTLKDLQLDYLDLYMIHWPFPNYHAPHCDVDSRNPDSRPYIHAEYMAVWRQMEELVRSGLVRSLGTSNMTIPKMELLLADAEILPVINEMELHPHFQQPELFDYMVSNDIVPIGYSPVGSPGRPERDRTADDSVDIEDPVIVRIAERLNVHPAVVCIKWAVQRGQVPIPFSVKPEKILSNLEGVIMDPITEEEMKALKTIDRQCRLIKGQVFLWEGAKGWEDLWDLDGTITK